MATVNFNHNGKSYIATGIVVSDDAVGLEMRVTITDSAGRIIWKNQDCASLTTQIGWFKKDMDEEDRLDAEYFSEQEMDDDFPSEYCVRLVYDSVTRTYGPFDSETQARDWIDLAINKGWKGEFSVSEFVDPQIIHD